MAEQQRVSQVQIGQQDDGSGRVFKVRPQTFRLRQQLAEMQDAMFALGMDTARITSELTSVARKLDALARTENGYDREAAEQLRNEANGLGTKLRELEDQQIELRMRMLARRLDPVDEEWLLDRMDERRLEELEEQIIGRPPTPTTD